MPQILAPAAQSLPRRVLVIADARERGSQLLQLLEESPSFELRIGCLRWGDYLIENQVTVERKRYDDFAVSLVDGRLFAQAAALSRLSRPLILVEGPRERPPGVHPHAPKGTLLSLATAWRLPVVFSKDAAESVGSSRHWAAKARRTARPILCGAGTVRGDCRAAVHLCFKGCPVSGPWLLVACLNGSAACGAS